VTAGPVILTWADVGVAVEALAQQVVDSAYRPDVVLSVARGGMAVGMALAYALDVAETTTIDVRPRLGPTRAPLPDATHGLHGRRVLIVDDVADTGQTLRRVLDVCGDRVADARTAVVVEKQRSVVLPDYAWWRVDAWVELPWSTPAPAPAARRLRA
jgi:uncharacterized protein